MRPMNAASTDHRLFSDLEPRRRRGLHLGWWSTAGLVHLALLAIPVGWYAAQPRPADEHRLAVQIEAPPPTEKGDPWHAPVHAPAPLADLPERPAPDRPETPAPAARHAAGGQKPLDVNRLLSSVAAMDWTVAPPANTPGPIGRAATAPMPGRPVLPLRENRLDGLAAPSAVQVQDRWVSPDGAHNVVMRTPDGNTYCGRQEAADDLRPWLQMPMMFRACGGGGNRWKGASWRNN